MVTVIFSLNVITLCLPDSIIIVECMIECAAINIRCMLQAKSPDRVSAFPQKIPLLTLINNSICLLNSVRTTN
ncbi:hypothetical protein D3C73_1006270 [compost metagenome]